MASLLTSVYKIGNLLYIIVLIIVIIMGSVVSAYWLAIPLAVNFASHSLKSFQLYRKKVSQEMGSKIKLQTIHKLVYGTKASFEDIYSDKLEIGDLILLKKDEVCTADILILACREDKCYIETAETEGTIDFRQVRPVASTNEENMSIQKILKSYKYTLNGKIEYHPMQRDQHVFEGYLKLENDPKGESLQFQNLIRRGNFLRNTDWVLGIVLEFGYTNTQLSVKQVKIARDKYIMKFLNRFIQMATLWICLAIFSAIFWKNIHSTASSLSTYSKQSDFKRILDSVVVYCQGVPVLLYGIVHFSYGIIKNHLEKKYKKKIEINNSSAISNLSHLDIALFSLSGAFISSDLKESVRGVYFNGSFYSGRDDLAKEIIPTATAAPQLSNRPNGTYYGEEGIDSPLQNANPNDSNPDKHGELLSNIPLVQLSHESFPVKSKYKSNQQANGAIDGAADNYSESHQNMHEFSESKPHKLGVEDLFLPVVQSNIPVPNSFNNDVDIDESSLDMESIGVLSPTAFDERSQPNETKQPLQFDSKNKFGAQIRPTSISIATPNFVFNPQNKFGLSVMGFNQQLSMSNIMNISQQSFDGQQQQQLNSFQLNQHSHLAVAATASLAATAAAPAGGSLTNDSNVVLYKQDLITSNDSSVIGGADKRLFSQQGQGLTGSKLSPSTNNARNNFLSPPMNIDRFLQNRQNTSEKLSLYRTTIEDTPYNNNNINSNIRTESLSHDGRTEPKLSSVRRPSRRLSQAEEIRAAVGETSDEGEMDIGGEEDDIEEEIDHFDNDGFTESHPADEISEEQIKMKKRLQRFGTLGVQFIRSPSATLPGRNLHHAAGAGTTGGTVVHGSQSMFKQKSMSRGNLRKAESVLINSKIPTHGTFIQSSIGQSVNRIGQSSTSSRRDNRISSQMHKPRSGGSNLLMVSTNTNNNNVTLMSNSRIPLSQPRIMPGYEFLRWKDMRLAIATTTNAPKLDEKLTLVDLFAKAEIYNSTDHLTFIKGVSFLKALALCHNMKTKKQGESNYQQATISEKQKKQSDTTQEKSIEDETNSQQKANLIFEASSKDEDAQMAVSKDSGISFLGSGFIKSKQFYDIKYKGKTIRYEVKGVSDWTPTRRYFAIALKVDEKHLNTLLPHNLHHPYPTNHLSSFNQSKKLSGYGQANSGFSPSSRQKALTEFIQNEPKNIQIFMKGAASDILPRCFLSKSQNDAILKDLESQQSRGLRSIFFARRILPTDTDFKKGIEENAKNMEYLGSICLKQRLIPGTSHLVNLFQSAGILNWLITSDSANRVLAAAYQAKMIFHDTTMLTLDQLNVEELKYQIKNHLLLIETMVFDEDEYGAGGKSTMTESGLIPPTTSGDQTQSVRSITKEQYKRRMSTMNQKGKNTATNQQSLQDSEKLNRVALLVNGAILNIVLNNEYLRAHFAFLCLACQSLIGFNFTQTQKALLVKLIQECGNGKTTVGAFGYGSKDSLMMNQSNFSFMLRGQSTCQTNIGDITIPDYSKVRQIVFEDSVEISDKLQYLVVTNTKLIIFIMFLNYFYQLQNYQIHSDIVSSYQIILNIFISQTVGSLYIMMTPFSGNAQNALLQIRPEFYRFRRSQNSWLKSHFIDCIFYTGLHAFTASLLLANPLMSFNAKESGQLLDYESAQDIYSFVMGLVLIFIILAGPMKHDPFKLTAFIGLQTFVAIAPSLLKNITKTQKEFASPFIFSNLFTVWQLTAICLIMLAVFSFEYVYTKYLRYYFFASQFQTVFAMFDLKFSKDKTKTFQDKLKLIIKEVRMSSEFLGRIIIEIFTKTEIDPFLRKILDPAQKIDGSLDLSNRNLSFKDKKIEKAYLSYRYEIIRSNYLIPLVVILTGFFIRTIIIFIDQFNQHDDATMEALFKFIITARLLSYIGMGGLLIAMVIYRKTLSTENFELNFRRMITIFVFLTLLVEMYDVLSGDAMTLLSDMFFVSFLCFDGMPPPSSFPFGLILLDLIGAIGRLYNNGNSFQISGNQSGVQNQIIFAIVYFVFIGNSVTIYFTHEKGRRITYSTKNRIKYEENTVDHILANLLPPFVRARFNTSGNASIEEDQGEVAILFLDICDFDPILKQEQSKLIEWLDNLYRLFDKICVEYGVQKIETVGKIYMACAGLKLTKEERLRQQKMLGDNETKRLLLAAQEMQIKAKMFSSAARNSTEVKIGIHYGKVIAGVIGAHKPQFSLIGDTVNTASRVCSSCKQGRITLSEEARQRIGKTEWIFIEKEVEAKGKGVLKVFSLAENIRSTIIKVNNDVEAQFSKKFNINSRFLSKAEIDYSNHTLFRQGSIRSQKSDSVKGSKKSIDFAIGAGGAAAAATAGASNYQQNTQSAQVIASDSAFAAAAAAGSIRLVNNNLSNSNHGSRSQGKRNKTVMTSSAAIDQSGGSQILRSIELKEISENAAGQNSNDSNEASHNNNNSNSNNMHPSTRNPQIGYPSVDKVANTSYTDSVASILTPVIKRKIRYSRTMVVAPRNSLLQQNPVNQLDTLEICDIEDSPEKNEYKEEDRRESGVRESRNSRKSRPGTIVFTSPRKKKLDLNSNSQQVAQEPMLKVTPWLLRYQKGSEDIVTRFELMTCIEGSRGLPRRSYVIQLLIHVLILLMISLNLEFLSLSMQAWMLVMKVLHCTCMACMIVVMPKFSQKVLIMNVMQHVNFVISHALSIVLAFEFKANLGIMYIIFIEHISIVNFAQNVSVIPFWQTLYFSFVLFATWLYIFLDGERYQEIIILVILSIFEIYRCYTRWDVKILNFNNLVAHEIKKFEKDNLLKYLVPKHILTQFLQNKKQYNEISETLEKVTLLFADIAGFTSYSSNKHPSEVVKMLRNLFTSFDQLCLKHKVYKVYTIGDCYVVLGIVDKYNRSYHDECENVVQMGFSMIKVIENIKREHKDFANVNMRIGIHLGQEILGGIIGTNIVRYDIFGKDVLIANKMESNGSLGKVTVSEDTKKFLENHFPQKYKFDSNKVVELSNFPDDDGAPLKISSFFISENQYQVSEEDSGEESVQSH